MFLSNFDNPLYDSIIVNSDAVETGCSQQDAHYDEIQKENIDDESDADSEGYLKVSSGRLSLDGSDDGIYDKVR